MLNLNSRPALLACAVVLSASLVESQSCSNSTTTIRGPADASTLASCKTFTGTIAVATDAPPTMEIGGVQAIEGDFVIANNPGLSTIAAAELVHVSGTATFDHLPILNNLTFPMWESVGTLNLSAIANPNYVDLKVGVQQVQNFYITNTQIENFQGLPLTTAQMDVLYVVGNKYLQDAYFQIGNISQQVTLRDNGGALIFTLPMLQSAYNMEIEDASMIVMPQLKSINQDFIVNSGPLQNLSLPNLTYIGGDFNITDNSLLTDLFLEELIQIGGGLNVVDNLQLNELQGLSALSHVGGGMVLQGPFTNASVPSLTSVEGNVYLDSTSKVNCSDIPDSIITDGTYECNGVVQTSNSTSGSPGDKSSSSSGLSGGAIAGIVIGIVAFVLLVVAAIAIFISQKKKKARASVAELDGTERETSVASPRSELSGGDTIRAWLGRSRSKSSRTGPDGRYELPSNNGNPEITELPANERYHQPDLSPPPSR